MAIDPAALNSELTTDPRGYGYATDIGISDSGVLTRLVTIRDGTNPPSNPTAAGGSADGKITVNRGTVSTQELVEAIVQSEMPAGASQRDWLIMVASGDRVRVDSASTARAGLMAIFPAGSTTRTNLVAIAQRSGSRAEELFGINTVVTLADISIALRGQA